MMFSPLVWALFSFTLMIAVPGALASSSPKRTARKATSTRVTVETYPAMEDGELAILPESSVPALVPSALPKPGREKPEVLRLGQSAPIFVPSEVKAPIAKYEVVPSEKRGQIVKRISLCQALIMESGRAYDYRTMTTEELEKELGAVRASKPMATR